MGEFQELEYRAASIVQPRVPPVWFRVLLLASFLAWVSLQAVVEYFTLTTLYSYAHVAIFQTERQVDSAFLNIVAVGLLTAPLAAAFLYGVLAPSRLSVFACCSLLASLLILNVLAVSVLMSSKFGLAMGPQKMGEPVLNLQHPNVTAEHWYQEIQQLSSSTPAAAAGDGQSGVLEFLQLQAGCCGVKSYRDYADRPLPVSCRCTVDAASDDTAAGGACTAEQLQLSGGNDAAVWRGGCEAMIGRLLASLYQLRDLLVATVVCQLLVVVTGVVLALNMPSNVDNSSY